MISVTDGSDDNVSLCTMAEIRPTEQLVILESSITGHMYAVQLEGGYKNVKFTNHHSSFMFHEGSIRLKWFFNDYDRMRP